jgi:TonB family protein
MPHMLAELEDELARSRKRESFWISVVVHIVFVLLIVFSPQLLPNWAQPHLLRAEDLARTKAPIFLTLPQDMQKPPEKVHTDKLSDKNRIAETRHPQIDRKTLETLRTLGNQMPPSPPPGMPSMPELAQPAPPSSSQAATNQPPRIQPRVQPTEPPQEAPVANAFKMPGSAGDSIAQAARNTRKGFGGGSGGYGYGQGSSDRSQRFGGMDILSDTQGVDFGPYLARIHPTVQRNWMLLEPVAARPPMMKHGKVTIRLIIMPDGKVVGMNIESSSGDVSLDRAAWGSLTASSPLPPLPSEFHGPYLELLCRFYYNPATGEMEREQ